MPKILDFINPGVITGNDMKKMFCIAREKKFAIPAVNCIGTDSINAVLETAARVKSPVIIQLSNGGSSFIAGKYLKDKNQKSAIIGAISAAYHVHKVARNYGVPVILHTDHCSKKLLPWIDGLLKEGESRFSATGQPLFSSHMIDLSDETLSTNVEICSQYLSRISAINMVLEIELGCTGGEEDGVDNSNKEAADLYTQPKDIEYLYSHLIKISPNFVIAAAFGNVHGVYNSKNIVLKPKILKESQKYISKIHQLNPNSVDFVFHGGSGSSYDDIKEAIDYGVVKMNIDTDIQWANWSGIKNYYIANKLYLNNQLGNPLGKDAPNKKYYDPRMWLRAGQISMINRLEETFKKLNAVNIL